MHGQFIWYELATPDVDAAQKFYPRFTGWGTQPFDKDYTMWTNAGVPIGGLFRLTDEMRQQGVPPNWMPYVESSNVDETAAKAQSLGGRIVHGPDDIPGTGRIAVLQDPQGATFGIYKPNNPGGAWDGTSVVGRFSWHELMTTDHVKAAEFYRALFGWEEWGEAMDMGGGNMYAMFGKGDKGYGGMFNRMPDMGNMPPFWLVYINVPDVGKAVASAVKAGGAVHRPQMDIPGGSIAILGDPQGAGFALHHVNAQPVAARPAAKTTVKKAAKKVAKKVAKVAKTVKKAVKTAAKKVARKVAPTRKHGAKVAAKKSSRRSAVKKAVKRVMKKAARKAPARTRPKAKARTAAKRTRR